MCSTFTTSPSEFRCQDHYAEQQHPDRKQQRDPFPVRDDHQQNEAARVADECHPPRENGRSKPDRAGREHEHRSHLDGKDVQEHVGRMPTKVVRLALG